MADNNLNAHSGNTDQTNKTSSSSGSPWDESIDIPEDDNHQAEPAIIGSLEPERKEDTNPVPFNVPEEVIEDKVGKKILASEVIGKNSQSTSPQMGEKPKPVQNVTEDKQKNNPQNTPPGLASQNILKQTVPPRQSMSAPVHNSQPTSKTNISLPSYSDSPANPNQKIKPQNISTVDVVAQNNNSQQPIANATHSQPKKDVTPAPNSEIKPITPKVEKELPKEEKPKESGVSELLKKDDFDPFAPIAPETTNPEPESPEKSFADQIIKSQGVATNPSQTSGEVLEKKSRQIVNNPKPAEYRTSDQIQSNNNIDTVRAVNNIKPQNPQPTSLTEATPILENTARTEKVSEKGTEIHPQKPSLISKLNIFSRRQKTEKKANLLPEKIPSENLQAKQPLEPTDRKMSDGVKVSKPKKKMSPAFSIIVSIIFALAAAGYLTEIGLLSVGLENIYGFAGLEKIWGGLPKTTESALGMAIVNQQQHMSFKYSGKITATVDKTKKSPITSPLVSYGDNLLPMTDIQIGMSQSALLTQSDYRDYYSDDSSDLTDNSSDSSSSTADSTNSNDGTNDVISPTPSQSSDTSATYDQSDSSYTTSGSTFKQLNFEVQGKSSEKAANSSLVLTPLVGSKKYIELVNSNGKIYTKSDDITFNSGAVSGKWLEYSLAKLSEGNNLLDLFKMKIDSGFTITGSRVGNEKIKGVRSYKYQIENMDIGDSLKEIGIPGEAINSINGYVWIGVHDHLIHKAEVYIVPSISAGFTKIDAELEFYDYNISNEISVPSLSDVIKADNTSEEEIEVTPTDPITVEPDPVATDPSARIANDSTRHADLVKIKEALNRYKSAYGRYPISSSFENISLSSSKLMQALVPSYISTIPTDPNSGLGWWYGYKSNGISFTLSARFENINDTEVTKSGDVYLHYVKN